MDLGIQGYRLLRPSLLHIKVVDIMCNEFEGIKAKFISCLFDNTDICEQCGHKLVIDKTRVPYGDTYYEINTSYCKYCEQEEDDEFSKEDGVKK